MVERGRAPARAAEGAHCHVSEWFVDPADHRIDLQLQPPVFHYKNLEYLSMIMYSGRRY
jgi:hypothetical protein